MTARRRLSPRRRVLDGPPRSGIPSPRSEDAPGQEHIALAMRRSDAFRGVTAWTGILAHAFELGLLVALAVAPAIATIPPSISALFLLAWYNLSGVRLLRLARGALEGAPVRLSGDAR